jgi:hypothetical protein
MNSLLLKVWLSAIIAFFTGFSPAPLPQKNPAVVPLIAQVPAHHVIRKVAASSKTVSEAAKSEGAAATEPTLPTYLFSMSGVATEQGVPNGNAEITLLVITPYGQETHKLQTAADGSYKVTVSIHAKPNDPVDWEIKGQTVDYKTVSRMGRQIARMDEPFVSVQNSLNFIAQ